VSELLCLSALDAVEVSPTRNGMTSSTTTVYPSNTRRLRSLDGLAQAQAMPFIREVVPLARVGDEIGPPRDYRGAVCQVRTTADSAVLAFNSAQVAGQLVAAGLEE
jgi:hypothetical protein